MSCGNGAEEEDMVGWYDKLSTGLGRSEHKGADQMHKLPGEVRIRFLSRGGGVRSIDIHGSFPTLQSKT